MKTMEIKVTKSSVALAKTILHRMLQEAKALQNAIKLVEGPGASTPDGLKTTGKKAAKKATKATTAKATPEKVAKKATPEKAAKKATPEKTAKKATPEKEEKKAAKKSTRKVDAEGKKVGWRARVQEHLSATYNTSEVWSPKALLSSEPLEGLSNVGLAQILKVLKDETKEIEKISKGKYKRIAA